MCRELLFSTTKPQLPSRATTCSEFEPASSETTLEFITLSPLMDATTTACPSRHPPTPFEKFSRALVRGAPERTVSNFVYVRSRVRLKFPFHCRLEKVNGQRSTVKGQRAKGKGQRAKGKGQGARGKGQWAKGQRAKGKR